MPKNLQLTTLSLGPFNVRGWARVFTRPDAARPRAQAWHPAWRAYVAAAGAGGSTAVRYLAEGLSPAMDPTDVLDALHSATHNALDDHEATDPDGLGVSPLSAGTLLVSSYAHDQFAVFYQSSRGTLVVLAPSAYVSAPEGGWVVMVGTVYGEPPSEDHYRVAVLEAATP